MDKSNKKVIGAILLSVGILALLGNFHLTHHFYNLFRYVFNFFWPALFLLIGTRRLIEHKNNSFSTFIFLFFGLYFLKRAVMAILPNFALLDILFWPLILIVSGLVLIFNKSDIMNFWTDRKFNNYSYYNNDNYDYRDFEEKKKSQVKTNTYTYQKGHIPQSTIKIDSKQEEKQHNYKTINNNMGSKRIIIKNSDLAAGTNTLKLNNSFGDMKIIVPRDINIKLDGEISLGKLNFLSKEYSGINQTAKAKFTAKNSDKLLHIYANISLGDITIIFADKVD